MSSIKDNFSSKSDLYAKFRPTYPKAMFDFIFSFVKNKKNAWDCGTGTGQVAIELAKVFEKVEATDISTTQIQNAIFAENVAYSVQAAENTNLPDHFFNLITVAQAIHWFDFEAFYREVRRVIKPDGVLAVIGYGLIQSNEAVNAVIATFYQDIIGKYWDKERKYLDENYETIPFPFGRIQTPHYYNQMEWNFEHLIGYLNTWSAVKHYTKQNNINPIDLIYDDLKQAFGEKNRVKFPIFLKMTRSFGQFL